MRQRASLDIIADDRAGQGTPTVHDDADAEGTNAPEDSRSTSSTSSPAPVDNEESDFFLVNNDSQSSLGVVNLQDMQVSDDLCQPPVSHLPNEILISIFSKLNSSSDVLHVMLTCKRWARNAVDILWHRPACSSWDKHRSICQTLGVDNPYFCYRDFIKRLNLASLADKVNDGSVMPLAVCTRVERLTLTGCKGLTDSGLIALVQNSSHLLALDISLDDQITEASINAIAENCRRLQGLNVSGCNRINNESMIKLAMNCRFIKRLKLNDCSQLTNEPILAFAEHCPNILEIDLHQCKLVGNEPVTSLLAKGQSLRELRLANCDLVDDLAFLSLPPNRTYEHLRILDLTSCAQLTDRAVEKIIDVAPRLRNLVLAKCRNITDAAVYAISRLNKNLHYLHLGHCGHITDDSVKKLIQSCSRIRYIDLGCCAHLTDDSVMRLATLPKLKRIGLVKCVSITDDSIDALAKANQRLRPRRDAEGNIIQGAHYTSHSSLERVHLSYCTNLTLKSIKRLLNACPRLTHLSLTGVTAFLRSDLAPFCRDAPPEFTEHQRNVFCVFSGQGVVRLRHYLNTQLALAQAPGEAQNTAEGALVNLAVAPAQNDTGFDDGEPDAVEDDDTLEDGTEMVIDTQPLLAGIGPPLPNAPPPPPHATANPFGYVAGHPPYVPQHIQFPEDPMTFPPLVPQIPVASDDEDGVDPMDVVTSTPTPAGASIAGFSDSHSHPQSSRSRQASGAGPSTAAVGPSTASVPGPSSVRNRLPTIFGDGGSRTPSPGAGASGGP